MKLTASANPTSAQFRKLGFSIYLILVVIIYGLLPVWVGIAGLIFVYLISFILLNRSSVIIFPFYVYPFMFLIRAQAPSEPILAILPDLFAIASIACCLNQSSIKKSVIPYAALLLPYAFMLVTIVTIHIDDASFLPLVVRQYLLPILFVLGFLISSSRLPNLPIVALKVSINAFGLVSFLSLLNVTGLLSIQPSLEALYPYLNCPTLVCDGVPGRIFFDGNTYNRLNLMTGGALGSSAALFFSLGLVPWLKNSFDFSFDQIAASVTLLLSSLLALSTSIVLPVLFFIFCYLFMVLHWSVALGSCLLVGGFLLSSTFFLEISVTQYVLEALVFNFGEFVSSLRFIDFLFGVGPRFTTQGYEFTPDRFIIDVGLFRIFVETGIFTFVIFY